MQSNPLYIFKSSIQTLSLKFKFFHRTSPKTFQTALIIYISIQLHNNVLFIDYVKKRSPELYGKICTVKVLCVQEVATHFI